MRIFALLTALSLPIWLAAQRKVEIREITPNEGFEIINPHPAGPRLLARVPRGKKSMALKNPVVKWLIQSYAQAETPLPVLKDAGLPSCVEPLLSDTWHQFAPYNALTPTIDGEHCATGCVAHSMAEIIRYHRYAACPESYTYIDSLGCGQTLTAHFPAQGYDFDHMLDCYEEGSYSPQEVEAVASLLRDCGIAVDMKYGVKSSAAHAIRQCSALVDCFGYDPGVQFFYRDFYSYAQWTQMLQTELAAGRPILMTARSASLSHAFCCDGYNEEGLFHIRLGNGGDDDGYYYLPFLTPHQPSYYDIHNPEKGLNVLQMAALGVQPRLSPASQPAVNVFGLAEIESLSSHVGRKDSVVVATHYLSNVGWNECDHALSLALENEGNYIPLVNYPQPFTSQPADTLAFVLPKGIADGRYRLVVAHYQYGQWHEARTSQGVPNYLTAHINADSIAVQSDHANTAELRLENFAFPDTVVRNSKPEFAFTLSCSGAEFCGRFYVILTPEDNPNDFRVIQYQGIWLADGETTHRTFCRSAVPVAAGNYHLRLAYDYDLFTDRIWWLSRNPLKTVTVVEPTVGINFAPAAHEMDKRFDLSGREIPSLQPQRGIEIREGVKVLSPLNR